MLPFPTALLQPYRSETQPCKWTIWNGKTEEQVAELTHCFPTFPLEAAKKEPGLNWRRGQVWNWKEHWGSDVRMNGFFFLAWKMRLFIIIFESDRKSYKTYPMYCQGRQKEVWHNTEGQRWGKRSNLFSVWEGLILSSSLTNPYVLSERSKTVHFERKLSKSKNPPQNLWKNGRGMKYKNTACSGCLALSRKLDKT